MLAVETPRIAAAVPVIRYRDLPAAIDWLCRALSFEKHHVAVGKDGDILFAQLTLGSAMIMVGPVRASAFDSLLRQPDEIGGVETQVCYFFVADARAHSARAKAAGAEIIFDIEDAANGGRSYSCRDPEGHLWNFGTYDPWQGRGLRPLPPPSPPRKPLTYAILGLGLLVGTLGVGALVGGRHLTSALTPNTTGGVADDSEALAQEQEARMAAQQTAKKAEQRAAKLLLEMEGLQRTAVEAKEQLAQAVGDKEAAERTVKDAQQQLTRALIGRSAALRSAREARRQLAKERSTKPTAATPGMQ